MLFLLYFQHLFGCPIQISYFPTYLPIYLLLLYSFTMLEADLGGLHSKCGHTLNMLCCSFYAIIMLLAHFPPEWTFLVLGISE